MTDINSALPDTSKLESLAEQMRTAERALEAANSARSADKQNRLSSIRARLRDWFTTTPAEAAVIMAEGRHQALDAKLQSEARTWVVERATNLLLASSDAKAYEDRTQRHKTVQTRFQKVANWLQLARSADSALNRARSECSSAMAYEAFDAFSSNKAISLASSVSTLGASEAVANANSAVKALVVALPKRAESGELKIPDDLLDLVFDFSFDFSFDFLSVINLSQLQESADQCEAAAIKLQPLITQLISISVAEQQLLDQILSSIRSIEAPYLELAATQVPQGINYPNPVSIF